MTRADPEGPGRFAPSIRPDLISGRASYAARFLGKNLHAIQIDLTKLHIPVYITFSDYLSSRDIVLARAQDIEDFWRSWRTGTVREDLLMRYGVNWIVASRNETPAALGGLPASVFGKLEIKQEFTNGEFIIFRVHAIHGKGELGCIGERSAYG